MANPNQKYYLTYDFRLIYNATAILKEFDSVSYNFKTLDVYIDLNNKAYKIPEEYVGDIIQVLYREPLGYELSDDKMQWIMKFEDKLQENTNILRNRSLVFNYLILKLLLCGFPERIAKEFIISYYTCTEIEVQPLEIIQKINYFISKKKYWIFHNTKRDRTILQNFLTNVLKTKIKNSSTFNFEYFREEDKELCTTLIIPKLIQYNSTESYLVRNPISLTEQKPYLMKVYELFVRDIIDSIIYGNLRYPFESFFIDNIISEMLSDANNYLNILELNPNYFQRK